MNEKIELVMNFMSGLGYPMIDMEESIEKNRDSLDAYKTPASVCKMLCTTLINNMVHDGYLFNSSLFQTYITTITSSKDICTYKDFISRFFVNVEERLVDKGYSRDTIDKALDGKEVATLEDAEAYVEGYLKRLEEQEANKQRQIALDRKQDYVDEVYVYIRSRNVTVVHPRELADEFYNSLTASEKEQYGNNPTYAVHCCLGDTRLQEALSKCLARFNHSKMVDKVIEDYCNEYYPDEPNRSMLIDKIATNCPSVLKSDDVRANAYQAIISLQSAQVNETQTQDIGDDHISVKKAAANFAAKFLNGESMSVARDTCDANRKVAEQASETLTHNTTGTTEEAVKEQQEKDPEWAKEVKAQMAEYQKTIAEMQKQIQQQDKLLNKQNNQYVHQPYGYANPYGYQQGYSNGYGYNQRPRLPMWLFGVAANLLFMLIVFFIGTLTDLPIALGQIGLLLAAIGYPMIGRHKDAKRFLIIGYGMFIIWLMWTVLL